MQELLRWANGWVYAQFGTEGLLAFRSHPWLYLAVVVLVALLVLAVLLAWLLGRLRSFRRSVRLTLGLVRTARGRRCLRVAREIRRGGVHLRDAVRRGIEERSERRALLQLLARFTRSELALALEQALRLIARANDRLEQSLRTELERQQHAWSAAPDADTRERLQQGIAETRQQLALVSAANLARDAHLRGLEEAARAVLALEHELGELQRLRDRALPEFHQRLSEVSEQVSHLSAAYRELNAPR